MLTILSLFTRERSELTVEQTAQLLNATTSTTYRYFASLAKAGLIAPVGLGRYIVGPAAIHLDWLMRNTDPMIAAARPAMAILAGALNSPAVLLLCRLYHGRVMCVAQESVRNPSFATSYQRGRPMPLFRGAASKIILANLSDRALRNTITRNHSEMTRSGMGTTDADIRRTLRSLRTDGYCVTSGELDKGVTGVAAPILFRDTSPGGSLAFVLPDDHADPGTIDRLSRLIMSAAAQISRSLTPEQKLDSADMEDVAS